MTKKNAFTIAEVLISMAIIGVISVFGIYTVQNFDKGIRYKYANVYHNLDRALFNAANFSDIKSPFNDTELNDAGSVVPVSAQEGAARLCRMFTEYISSASANCNTANLASTDGISFGSVKFQSLTGVNFYITKRLPDNPSPGDHTFFIVYADLNGDRPPNSMNYVAPSRQNRYTTTDPDVFAFAALDTGRVCPLGIPEIEPRYIQARIAYFASNREARPGNNDDTVQTKFSVVSIPYYQAKAQAWGYYTAGDAAADRFIIDEEPTTYNGYIRSKLPGNTRIYSFMNGAATLRVPAGVSLQSRPVNNGGFGCVYHSADECWVIVDKYLY